LRFDDRERATAFHEHFFACGETVLAPSPALIRSYEDTHMFKRVWKFFALDWQRKKLLIQAFFLMGFVRVSLSKKPFKELVAELELHREAVLQPPLELSAQETARSVGWAVRTAANFTPWNSTCLVQVLAAQRMLRKRAVSGVFYLGAATGSNAIEGVALDAHAWLKCGDQFITGEQGHERFTVVSAFSWP